MLRLILYRFSICHASFCVVFLYAAPHLYYFSICRSPLVLFLHMPRVVLYCFSIRRASFCTVFPYAARRFVLFFHMPRVVLCRFSVCRASFCIIFPYAAPHFVLFVHMPRLSCIVFPYAAPRWLAGLAWLASAGLAPHVCTGGANSICRALFCIVFPYAAPRFVLFFHTPKTRNITIQDLQPSSCPPSSLILIFFHFL